MTYPQYLASDFWRDIRKRLRQFPEYQKCHCCGFDQYIDLHHLRYTKIFSPKLHHHRNSIVALCRFCHNKVHMMVKEENLGIGQATRRWRRAIKKLSTPPPSQATDQ